MADTPAPDKAFPSGSWDTPENPALKSRLSWDLGASQAAPSAGYAAAPRAIQTSTPQVGVPQGNPFVRPMAQRPQGVPMLQRLRKAFSEMQGAQNG